MDTDHVKTDVVPVHDDDQDDDQDDVQDDDNQRQMSTDAPPALLIKPIHFLRNPPAYKLDSSPKGLCFIINIMKYHGNRLTERKGSQVDADRLKEIFEKMDFDVVVEPNLTEDVMKTRLQEEAHKAGKAYDCFFVAILSHGKEDHFYSADVKAMNTRDFINLIDAENCRPLLGKPKVFLIQACQGTKDESGIVLDSPEKDGKPFRYPRFPDLLAVFSTYPGYVSVRDEKKGSIFIQNVVSCLEQLRKREDMHDIIMAIRHGVARDWCEVKDDDSGETTPVIQTVYTTDTFMKHLFIDPIEIHPLRILLLGLSGTGKSSLGNTLLGKEAPKPGKGSDAEKDPGTGFALQHFGTKSKYYTWDSASRFHTILEVTDMPGLQVESFQEELEKSRKADRPRPNVVIFTERGDNRNLSKMRIQEILSSLPEEVKKFLIVVFNGLDATKGKTIEEKRQTFSEKMARTGEFFPGVIQQAEGRYMAMANNASGEDKERQAKDLFRIMQKLVKKNRKEQIHQLESVEQIAEKMAALNIK